MSDHQDEAGALRAVRNAVRAATAAGVDPDAVEVAVDEALGNRRDDAPPSLAGALGDAFALSPGQVAAVAAAVRGEVGAMMDERARRRDAYLRARAAETRAETAVLVARSEAAEAERQRFRETERQRLREAERRAAAEAEERRRSTPRPDYFAAFTARRA